MADIKSILRTAFPFLAAAASLGGPPAVLAASVLGKALGTDSAPLTIAPTASGITEALAKASATPDQLLAAQKAELDFQIRKSELEPQHQEEIERIAAADRDSARKREMAVRDNTARNLAYIYAAGFFITLAVEIWMAVAGRQIDQLAMKSIDVLLGCEIGMVLGSKEYYFGSSAGQDRIIGRDQAK